MDNQLFESLIGGPQPEDGSADRSNMASALRGQSDLGMLFSIAPGMEQVGQNMQKGALSQAKQIGDRREQGLTRTRQLERDRIGDEQWNTTQGLAKTREERLKGAQDYSQNRDKTQDEIAANALDFSKQGIDWSRLQTVQDPETKEWVSYAPSNDRSGLKRITELDGLTPQAAVAKTNPGRGFTTKTIPGTSVKYDEMTYGPYAGQMRFEAEYYSPEDWQQKQQELVKTERARNDASTSSEATAKLWADFTGEEATTMLENYAETGTSMGTMEQSLDKIVSAIDAGGKTGPIWNTIPSIRNASNQLDSAIDELDLEMLNKYKLTPVSDKDLAKLVEAASPELNNEEFREWALHKQEGIRRIRASNDIMETWVRENRRAPTPAERNALQDQVNKQLGDFEWAFDLDNIRDYSTQAAAPDNPAAGQSGGPVSFSETTTIEVSPGKYAQRIDGKMVETDIDGNPL